MKIYHFKHNLLFLVKGCAELLHGSTLPYILTLKALKEHVTLQLRSLKRILKNINPVIRCMSSPPACLSYFSKWFGGRAGYNCVRIACGMALATCMVYIK